MGKCVSDREGLHLPEMMSLFDLSISTSGISSINETCLYFAVQKVFEIFHFGWNSQSGGRTFNSFARISATFELLYEFSGSSVWSGRETDKKESYDYDYDNINNNKE